MLSIKGQEESLEGDGYVYSLDAEDGFMHLYLSSNSSSCTSLICIVST